MSKSGVTDLNGQQTISGPVEVVQPDGTLLHVTVDAGTITVTQPVAVTGPLTDTQLRATPVPISGTVTAIGPLTDTQLRASPVPVTASITGTPNVTVTNGAGASAVNIQDGGNSITIDAVNLDIRDLAFATDKIDVSGSSVTVSGTVSATQSGTWTNTVTQATGTNLHTVIDSGTITTITNPVAVTGPLTDTQLRASPVDVNVTSVVASNVTVTNAAGASAVNIQDGGNSITVDNGGTFLVQAAQSGTWTTTVTQATGTNLHTVIDSGSITANAGTNLNTSALNLETTQTAISGKLPATLGQKAMAASLAVVVASDQTVIPTRGNRGTLTDRSGNATTSTTALAASNASRQYFFVQCLDGTIWINFTTAATTNQPSIRLNNGDTFVMEGNFISTEQINVISGGGTRAFAAKEG